MIEAPLGFFDWAVAIALAMLCASLIIAFVRLAKGPSLPDRVIALDLIAYIVIGFIAAYAVSSGQPAFLEAATALALIAFLGTIAFARYAQQAASRSNGEV